MTSQVNVNDIDKDAKIQSYSQCYFIPWHMLIFMFYLLDDL